ncbi:MAG: putative sulfate exporter family transporter [bacterium]
MRKEDFLEKWIGFILIIIIGSIAYKVAKLNKALDPLVLGIVFGMLVRTVFSTKTNLFIDLKYSYKIFIPVGIILYGVNLQFHRLSHVPVVAWFELIMGIVIVFFVSIYLGRKLSLKKELSFLIGIGTAICGASAIAIASPVVNAESEETGVSLVTITIWGMIGVLVYPVFLTFLNIPKVEYAFLCATTLHMTGFVKIAAGALGDSCVNLALSIKMARTAMIIPIIWFLCWHNAMEKGTGEKNILFYVPWFLWVFILMGLLTSFLPVLTPAIKPLKLCAEIIFTIALTSIGLNVDLRNILDIGGGALITGLITWLSLICVFVLFKGFIF